MPIATWNVNWLNHNSQRNYPLSEEATKLDLSGLFALPDSVLLALYFPVHAGLLVEPEKFFLRSLSVFATGLSISLAYDDGTSDPPLVATTNVAFSTHTEYRSYSLVGSDDFDDSVGKIVLGKLDDLNTLPPGQYLFDPEGGALDSDCIRPMIRGISSIVLVSGSDRGEKLQGDLELFAGSNVRLTSSVVSGRTRIRIDAIDGEGLTNDCACTDDSPCIKTINGVAPTSEGDISISGDDCINVDPSGNGLRLSDACSKPCCGCSELEVITRDLARLQDAARRLENFVTRLEGSVEQTNQVVLSSRIGDNSCNTGACEE